MIPADLPHDLQDLIQRMMTYDPRKRVHVRDIPEHPWFQRHARDSTGVDRGWHKRLPSEATVGGQLYRLTTLKARTSVLAGIRQNSGEMDESGS